MYHRRFRQFRALRANHARLAHEPGPGGHVVHAFGEQQLERDIAVQILVPGAIDRAHTARAEQAEARLQALEAARQLALTVLRDAEQARADASLADAAREPRA